ncbi:MULTISPECIES: hypothetical protein [Flavobacterium]|uniref:Uncharacterized protein n=1 Tax=Flavobacterium hankyongi TaxID=1176532 RepID=A0ABP8ZVC1_9FLAO|nr:hypothetical protein [Flavobacterium sp. N1846]
MEILEVELYGTKTILPGVPNNGNISMPISREICNLGKSHSSKNANTIDIPEGRLWIDLISSSASNSILAAYVNVATNGKDQMYDAQADLKATFNFYSLLDGYDRNVIQGRSVPFDQNDLVPLAIKVPSNRNYTIAIQSIYGFFSNPSQSIYLKDIQANITHDLNSTP